MTYTINPFQKLCERAFFASVTSFLFITTALAGPNGGQIEAGAGTITGQGTNNVLIHQNSNRIVINWNDFNSGVGDHVEFIQPSKNALAINRINNGTPTQILGSLRANGNVVVVNPNGVILGESAKVDVNKLVLSTADIATSSAMNDNRLVFDKPGNPNARIVNKGLITAGEAGLVGFIAPQVENSGLIDVKLGKAKLASGSTFTLDLAGDELVNIAVSDDTVRQLAGNSGHIKGNQIEITAAQARNVVDTSVINTGVLEATSISQKGGRIILGGGDAVVVHKGVINASGKSGGTVHIQAAKASLGGVIVATGDEGKGGTVTVDASEVLTVEKNNIIDVFGSESGTIALQSPWLYSSGTYLAQSDTSTGGEIRILGDHLYLSGDSYLNASGFNGGGHIYIGGDFQGKGELHTATTTFVDRGALFINDAVLDGNGGQTIIWSDDTTEFYGTILARGMGTGRGGFTEVSGKEHLNFQGNVDLTSQSGVKGELLLDPASITVYGDFAPNFVSTDGTINLATNLRFWGDAADPANVRLTYSNNGLGMTATGTMGGNTITLSAGAGTSLIVGARIRLGAAGAVTAASTVGADTYTITAISGTTITIAGTLTTNYTASTVYRGLVSQLVDKSGNSNNASQAAVGNMPLWVSNGQNGLGVLRFDGGDYLASVAGAYPTNSNYSVGTVVNQTSANTGNVLSGNGAGHAFYFNNSQRICMYSGGCFATSSTNLAYGTTGILSGTFLNATRVGNVYQNGTLVATGTAGTTNTANTFNMGSYGAGNYFTGYIDEAYLYNSVLTATQRQLLEQYFSGKWNVALNAPGTGATEGDRATSATGYDVFTTNYLERLSQTADVNLLATNLITLDLKGATLNLANDRSISLAVTSGSINSVSSGTIQTNRTGTGGNITFSAGGTGSVNISNITLNAQNGGAASVTAGGAVTLGAVNAGRITATSGAGTDLTLNAALNATGGGNSVVLNSGRHFINSGGSINPGAGRYLVYSANPGNNTLGGITVLTKRYNRSFAGYGPGSVAETGNVFLYSVAPVITVTADNASRVYGDADPAFTSSYTNFIDGDTAATALTGNASVTPVATILSNVGTSALTSGVGTLASDLGYTFTYVDGTLTITPAALTVTAENKTKIYGDGNPALTLSYTGLKNSDVGSTVFTGYTLGTVVDNLTGVGSHAITLTGGSAANYTVTNVDGSLAVTPAPLTVTADNKTKIYGDANPALTLDFNGLKNGDVGAGIFLGYTLSTLADASSGVNNYTITLTGGSAANYTVTNVDGTLAVTPAALTVTADNKTKVAGNINPLFTMTFAGLVNGDLESVFSGYTLSSPATNPSPAGTYAINLAGGSAANYTVTRVDGTLTVDPAAIPPSNPQDQHVELPYKQLFDPEAKSQQVIAEEKVALKIQNNCLYKIINSNGSVTAGSCGSGGR